MSVAHPSVRHRPADVFARAAQAGAWAGPGLLIGCALGVALARHPPPLVLTLAGGLALIALLGLALARFEAIVAVGFLLFGVVFVEPAPPDLVFGIAIAVACVTGHVHLRRVPPTVILLLGAFLVLNLLSTVSAIDAARAGLFFVITVYLIVFSIWLTSWVDGERRSRLILRMLIAGAVVSALVGSIAPFLPFAAAQDWHNAGRAKAFFEDPNVFGPFLVLPALLLVEELLEPRLLRSGRATKLALFLVLATGILFAYSRAAWLNAAVSALALLAVFSLRRGGGRKAFVLVGTIVVAMAVLAGAVAVSGSAEFLGERARLQTYDEERFAGQESALELVASHPFGIGPGQYEDVVGIAAHSTYIRALGEQGVLGLITVVTLFIVTLLMAARNAVLGRGTYGIGSAALFAAWCGILANSAFVDTLHWRHLWLLAALIWIGSMQPGQRWAAVPTRGARRDLPTRT
jgi:O-antigen ligase